MSDNINVEYQDDEITNIIIYADRKDYVSNQTQFDTDLQKSIQKYCIYEIADIHTILDLDENQKVMIENVKKIRNHKAKKISLLNNLV